ncbi:Y-family DNA polymerase [Vibrio sp. 1159]|uniref:Y-family DNA polymerase n=2 Tax=unclassified Vibrio TaxID=2614977 RepID=UPI002964070E|nr:Y-family DNA polymerase [Vibrio sp. 1159]MDW2322694.1 Y-family DNA polymerase [Vibrio sp. 1159]
MYCLADASAFYASCHQVFEVSWRKKPVIVLSNENGIIVAANKEALSLGINKFSAYFKVKALCDHYGVVVCTSNFPLYADISGKMMTVMSSFAPSSYVYSIDEQFQDYSGCEATIPDFFEHGMKIRRAVWKQVRIPVCCGFSHTLTLAKCASHASKRLPGFRGVCVLDTRKEIEDVLAKMTVDKVWGIGARLATRLKFMGLDTALQLSRLDPRKARREFSVEMERIVRELNGQRCKTWDDVRAPKKEIFSTRSTSDRLTTEEELIQEICEHAGIASRKARDQKSLCRVMVCFAGNSSYDERPVNYKAMHQFAYPTADADQITRHAAQMAREMFKQGVKYYRVGVGLIDLVDGQHAQEDLFNPSPNRAELMSVFDGLNTKYGKNTVFLAAQGIPRKWECDSAMKTPHYTTSWRDLPRLKC